MFDMAGVPITSNDRRVASEKQKRGSLTSLGMFVGSIFNLFQKPNLFSRGIYTTLLRVHAQIPGLQPLRNPSVSCGLFLQDFYCPFEGKALGGSLQQGKKKKKKKFQVELLHDTRNVNQPKE